MWLKTEKRFETGIERHWREEAENALQSDILHRMDWPGAEQLADRLSMQQPSPFIQPYPFQITTPQHEWTPAQSNLVAQQQQRQLKAKKVAKNGKNGHSK